MSNPGWLIALAILSLALPVGWSWFRSRPAWPENRAKFEAQWPGVAARFFYFAGLPYLALTSGLLTARFLGLKGLEHFVFAGLNGDFSPASFLAEFQKAFSLLLLDGLIDGGAMVQAGFLALLVVVGLRLSLAREGLSLANSFQPSLLSTIYDGLHWAFYRAIFWQLSGDLYLGVVWGVAWVLLEWTLTANTTTADRRPPTADNFQSSNPPILQPSSILWRTIFLILTAALFFYSPNLWLLWLVHLVLAAVVSYKTMEGYPAGL